MKMQHLEIACFDSTRCHSEYEVLRREGHPTAASTNARAVADGCPHGMRASECKNANADAGLPKEKGWPRPEEFLMWGG